VSALLRLDGPVRRPRPAPEPASNENPSLAAAQFVKVSVPVPTFAVVGAGTALSKRPPVVSYSDSGIKRAPGT
jgi:hypothetical protein